MPRPEPRPFPWAEAMAFGLGILKLAPKDFWAMTLPELAAATRGALDAVGELPMPRRAFEDLMRRFPDAALPGESDERI